MTKENYSPNGRIIFSDEYIETGGGKKPFFSQYLTLVGKTPVNGGPLDIFQVIYDLVMFRQKYVNVAWPATRSTHFA